jgi:hypothetical protein
MVDNLTGYEAHSTQQPGLDRDTLSTACSPQ